MRTRSLGSSALEVTVVGLGCNNFGGRVDLEDPASTLALLRQIAWAKRDGRRHLYLGYWIDGHGKMDYKRRFRPLEAFDGRAWQPMA